ncbi:MAG: DUF5131 family protein [Proteobacteria bacterium]|uniref:DUF5131 family protein n=1 Tax=Candidatus Avisuccinivibrio stercorigallinarum TaxID=2840704 RepID=A0A9D9GQH9_9GAMM|nr:DUF5131 family protein [Candidatus Avisuccinivibrio stercorigallinarum]
MHDIWNPWHGCRKASPGCRHCYMYYLDKKRGQDGSVIYKTQNFDYPVQRGRDGSYKIKPGEKIRVCMTSDFFLEDADPWRPEAFHLMAARPDVIFYLLTKRAHRIKDCLPKDYAAGFPNLSFNVSVENQWAANERLPYLLDLPVSHKGVMCAPLLGPVNLRPWLAPGVLDEVICGGENYDGSRPCDFAWVQELAAQCAACNIKFTFIELGSIFIKDGKIYRIQDKRLQSYYAFKSGISHPGAPIEFALTDPLGLPISQDELYQRRFGPNCEGCGSEPICNGCAFCGGCAAFTPPAPRP